MKNKTLDWTLTESLPLEGQAEMHRQMFLQDREHAMAENRSDRANRVAIVTLILSFVVGIGIVAFQPGDARYVAVLIPYFLLALAMFTASYNQVIDTNKGFILAGNEALDYKGYQEYVKATKHLRHSGLHAKAMTLLLILFQVCAMALAGHLLMPDTTAMIIATAFDVPAVILTIYFLNI